MQNLKLKLFVFCLLFSSCLASADNTQVISDMVANGIHVDLKEPVFEGGVLSTEKGGVIEGTNLRIQAQKIRYTRKKINEENISLIEAKENLIVEFDNYLFVGDRLEYDFTKRCGILYGGRTALEPWFFGGERIHLNADGSYVIYDAFVTTSENYNPEWAILAENAKVTDKHLLQASNVKFVAERVPLLKLPFFRANLGSIFDQPIRYEARAGSQGPRVSVAYEIFSWERFKTFARLDYRLQRGWGGGFENYYRSLDKLEKFESVNFIARDAKSSGDHHVAIRYRFQGLYRKELPEKKMIIHLNYDKLSDKEMATDYEERSIDIEAAGRTELIARKETDFWITNFLARARINSFQTTKQELPTLETNLIPFTVSKTRIISENQVKVSYLDFKYANSVENADDYRSSRLGLSNKLYRPIPLKQMTVTPEIGSQIIFEGNSPKGGPSFVGLGILACQADTRLYKFYYNKKHVIRPFARYEYYTFPTSSPNNHYIFDIDDGWYRLNILRFGVAQNFYYKDHNGLINRYLEADVFANAFFDSKTIPATIPKIYSRISWNPFYSLRYTCSTAWDFEENMLDHFNLRSEWTISQDMAIATEYRHRSPYSFRKADPYNFFVDAFHPINRLRHSQMSDRRDTFLVHLFYRLHPNWSLEFESRQGWNRHFEPSYNEFQIDLRATLWSAWNAKLSYQHFEDNDRFVFAISLGLKPPNKEECDCFTPMLQF
ncbi:MAG TPA: hypothetical protein PLC42_07425 [Parachlamydiaceae bacterium]|nr:hypothetical protein [Parachlamydiaceae bacterium]